MRLVLLSALFTLGGLISANAAPAPHIAVYDQLAAGGQGARIDGLLKGLKDNGYQAERITDLQLLTLMQYDIVYLSDMHAPGRVGDDWLQHIDAYVRSGGSVLQTWHHHILGGVGIGIQRVYGSRAMHIVPGHPAVAGMKDFDASFKDHIYERVGQNGTPLIKDDAGNVVAAAGMIGKGKVISTGLALAIPDGSASRPPRGAELQLLKGFLSWLTPDVPREQRIVAVLTQPRLEISPHTALTAGGFTAEFTARVGQLGKTPAQMTCEGAKVSETAKEVIGPAMLQSFTVTVPTPQRNMQQTLTVTATVGVVKLHAPATIETMYSTPPKDEIRGIWLHVSANHDPKVVMPELRRLGFNTVMLRVAGGTAAFYKSKVQPDIQDPFAPDRDYLAEAVKYAHANGLKIHAWVNNCIVEGRTSPESLAKLRTEGRLQQGPDGREIDWFCPSQEVNIEAIEKVMLELATRYQVDGIQYDFIRYPDNQGCFCPKCRALFEKETGKPVAHWPQDVIDGPRHAEWVEFRCRRIDAIVQRISTDVRRVAPKVQISADVFTNWPTCRESVGQDWVHWCQEGWVDFVCPMNYTLDPKQFADRTAVHLKSVPKDFPVIEGIGIASGAGTMHSPREVAVQIALARRAGAQGFLGFCYRREHTASLFEPLKSWE